MEKKSIQVTTGIQNSEIPNSISQRPIVLTEPLETIKLTLNPAAKSSVNFLPSKKLNTIPQMRPSGRPLKSKKIALIGAGVNENRSNAIQLQVTRPRIR